MDKPKRKRITMKLKTPNPLFEKWLTEWRDKAKRENSKMEYCFKLALQSLKKYPVPLERGRDCKILKGFGDKLCLMLDDKLREHELNAGSSTNDTLIANVKNFEALQKKSKRQSKEYFPQEGSGGYAILITLYSQNLNSAYPGFLTKDELITAAQPLSRTSFTKPDPGSRYTAWSSMKTLISKHLVLKNSNPAKFSLTDEGRALAEKLLDKGPSSESKINGALSQDTVQNGMYTIDSSDEEETSPNLAVKNGNSAKFFVSNEGQGTSSESDKNCSLSKVKVQNVIYCLDSSDEEETAPIFKEGSNSGASLDSEHFYSNQLNYQEKHNITAKCSSTVTSTQSSAISCISETEKIFYDQTNYIYTDSTSTQSSSSAISSEIGDTKLQVNLNGKSKGKAIKKQPSSSSVASSTQSSAENECFIFSPDTFDIILVVDNCETSGSCSAIQDDPILAELFRLGIVYEVKKLTIGDYVWICRDKVTKKELILPYIVERKRMDDLANSIKDGRYHEQKFRLKRCGIQNVTYLIENYGNNQHVGLPITTLYQAATNTAIQDGFCVKFTRNIRDTGKFLADLSTILTDMFKSKTLVSCPKDNLSEISPDDDLISIMTFKEFNQASAKNKPMRVTDLFVKMLLQIKGMSLDKAIAIVQEYPTPALLKKAYEENPGMKGEKLLASITFGDSKKNIGPALSKVLYQLFTLESFK